MWRTPTSSGTRSNSSTPNAISGTPWYEIRTTQAAMHACETPPTGGTLHGNLANRKPYPLRKLTYTPPGENSPRCPIADTVSAHGSQAQKPRLGAARAVMQLKVTPQVWAFTV